LTSTTSAEKQAHLAIFFLRQAASHEETRFFSISQWRNLQTNLNRFFSLPFMRASLRQ